MVDTVEIYKIPELFNVQTGTSYTLAASDQGKWVILQNASAITLTVPSTLAAGFSCNIIQGGAGQITVTPGSGATRRSYLSHTKTAGENAMGTIIVTSNGSGSAANFTFGGTTAP